MQPSPNQSSSGRLREEPPVVLLLIVLAMLLLPAFLCAWSVQKLMERRSIGFPWLPLGLTALAGFVVYIFVGLRPAVASLRAIATALFQQQYLQILLPLLLLWLTSLLLAPLVACGAQILRGRTAEQRLLQKELQRQSKALESVRKAQTALQEMPAAIDVHMALGAALGGDLEWKRGRWCIYPLEVMKRHAVMVGESRAGKSTTLFRVAYGAAHVYDWQVIYIDAKGNEEAAVDFFALMRNAGLPATRIKMFPLEPYDGWRGPASALFNRLISIEEFTDPYYRDVAKSVLNLVLRAPRAHTPRTSATLLKRLNKDTLKALYANMPEEQEIEGISPRDLSGVRHRYRAFFSTLEGQLDGAWGFEECDAAYILLKGLALKEEASSLGRFFVEEIAYYASERKPREKGCLVILDDYSAILNADTANLLERLAVYNTSVFVAAQTEEALGKQADRLLGTTATRILHRCSAPEKLLARAGTIYEVDRAHQIQNERLSGAGSLRLREKLKIDANDVRKFEVGQAVVVSEGRAQQVAIAPPSITERDRQEARKVLNARRPASPTNAKSSSSSSTCTSQYASNTQH